MLFRSFTGYKGRIAIYEILPVSEAIKTLLHQKASSDAIKRAAVAEGMTTLYQDGLKKIAAGLTTPEEIMMITQRDEPPRDA